VQLVFQKVLAGVRQAMIAAANHQSLGFALLDLRCFSHAPIISGRFA